VREYERLQLFKEHLEAMLVSNKENRSIFYENVEQRSVRKLLCSSSENEELLLSMDHGNLTPAEKERLHSFQEFSATQIGEASYRIPLGKDIRRAASMIEKVFIRIIGAPPDYSVEVRIEKDEDSASGNRS
jgi:hypothetical protein